MKRRTSLAVFAQLAGSTLAATAAADTIRVVPLTTSRMACNPVDGKLYATTPGTNSVTIVDPVAGTVGASIPVGAEPLQIAVSNTGRYVYVGLNADAAVRRVNTLTQTADLLFPVGVHPSNGRTMYAEDIKVMPGNENAVAIARRNMGLSPRHEGVGIYDNGFERPVSSARNSQTNVISWSEAPGTLYGFNNETTGFQTRRLTVDVSGVSIAESVSNLVSNFGTDIEYANGFLYSTNGPSSNGRKIAVATMTVAGNFPSAAIIEPDAGGGRLFTLASSGSPRVLRAYDLDTLAEVGTLNIPDVASGSAVSDLVRWGEDGLAFRTAAGQIVLVNTTLVVPSATGACCLMDGTCTTVTLPACSASAGLWRGQGADCAAANCMQPGACCMPDGSCQFVFESACGGVWSGAGVACGSCPQPPTGACCLGFGVCVIDWAGGCMLQGGLYRGDGSGCGGAACDFFLEMEPNSNKTEASSFVLQNGQAIAGVCTGTSATAGNTLPASLDYFRLKTTPAAAGIYRHRLVFSSASPGHSAWVRGLGQTAAAAAPWPGAVGTVNTSESNGQTHWLVGADLVNTWYGFGREEEVYYRVAGVAATTAPYAATLETTQVTPADLGTFNAGTITIDTSGQGHTNDTHLRIYDGQFAPIHGYANDDASINGGAPANVGTTSFLRREYAAGTYYMAVTIGNLATNQGSPCDDNVRNGATMDFPNVAATTGNTSVTDLSFAITDSAGTTPVPASRDDQGEVAWFKFTVTGTVGIGSCCFEDGTCTERSAFFCGADGGVYGGDGTACAPNPCPQPGACCFPNGSCQVLSAGQCDGLNGHFLGNGTTCGPPACPPAAAVVVPATHMTVEGTAPVNFPLQTAARTYQFIIASTQLSAIAPGAQINGLTWRIPSGAGNPNWPAADAFYSRYDIEVATAVSPPAAMSTTYAGNIGPDAVMVRQGGLTITAMSFRGGAVAPAINPFGLVIPFTTPFTYNGGNLVVTIRHEGHSGAARTVDSIATTAVGQAAGYGTHFRALSSNNVTSPTGTAAGFAIPLLTFSSGSVCYANCDESTSAPALNVADFTCFLQRFAAADAYTNCDGSTSAPVLNVADFTCFLQHFAAGCD